MTDISEKINSATHQNRRSSDSSGNLAIYALSLLATALSYSGCIDPEITPQHATRNKSGSDKNVELVKQYQRAVGTNDDGVIGEKTCDFLIGPADWYTETHSIGDCSFEDNKCHDRHMDKIRKLSSQVLDLNTKKVNHTFEDNYGTVRDRCREANFKYRQRR
ncbi:hypothetical protein ACFL0W_03785 [Nanoarchaeota archaeon]